MVAAPHKLWPRGTFWSVELMFQLWDSWGSRWILVFCALVFKLPTPHFPFYFFQTLNHCSEHLLLQPPSMTLLQLLWFFSELSFLHSLFEVCFSSYFLLLFLFLEWAWISVDFWFSFPFLLCLFLCFRVF